MSVKALQDYTLYAKYAHYKPELKRRETWREIVERVFSMHEEKYRSQLDSNPDFRSDFEFAKQQVIKKRVLGSQRALQFGGDPILEKHAKIYNCCVSYIDRPRAFQEIMYLLLCGCGVGFSVQKKHTSKLPKISARTRGKATFVIPDSIEGWSDAIGHAVNSFFESDSVSEYQGKVVDFDYSGIRPEGAPIRGGFTAPGPKGLRNAINKITTLISTRIDEGATSLRPIDVYDIIMHSSDAVLSGGVRRSATICIFSKDDQEMAKAKTGDWYITNPQRGRSNNSALLVRSETTREEFAELMKSVREFGEPGFVWAESDEILFNPCAEIGMAPYLSITGESGVQFCNLCEMNGKKIKNEEEFLQACRAAAIIGTLQAGYCDFPYLGKITEAIVKEEALLGVSLTGWMDQPEILFDAKVQRKGAKEILKVNEKVSQWIGINPAARATCVKPAGTTSCILGTSSGIHPHHSRRYIRRVQANKLEFPVNHFEQVNPLAVEDSVWSTNNTDKVISFLCEVESGAIVKNQIAAIDLLEKVKLTQQNWVESGTRPDQCTVKDMRHNVSNTITVKDDEWDAVEDYIFKNRKWFAGISLLPFSGDLDYPQAPFTAVHTPREIVDMYGNAAVFASGLIVDGLHAFSDNLWAACDCALGIGEELADLPLEGEAPVMPIYADYTNNEEFISAINNFAIDLHIFTEATNQRHELFMKHDWIRRAKQFAERYFEGNIRKMTHCLKDCYYWKTWCDLKREYEPIDWNSVVEDEEAKVSIDTIGAQACAGGKCELV